MKTVLTALVLTASAAAFAMPVQAKGCIQGAIVGGVAGHVAGGHGVAGAAAGCVIGRHHANKKAAAQTAPASK